ncbi:GDSL esterase/lipase [Quillaja saponaria]|uniref:GDSL esterase/lipase n=1 Tax=Quillaja saponaria TaxID=32244 RepID=A0AAD7LUT1_QUISA|nr:GDSL esterase/lipase [Quillaja saponaria]
MAACPCFLWSLQQQWIEVFLVVLVVTIPKATMGCYTSIFSFGDSLADTGNLYYSSQDPTNNCFLHPFGETYFQYPTGRCSDGRLVIDFVAEYFGIPLLKPYLGIKNGKLKDANVERGVNFAVAGSTALGIEFFDKNGIHNVITNDSLRIQLDWFKELLPSLWNSSSTSAGLKSILGSSLIFFGEIGGNDYNYPLFLQSKSVEEIMTYVPQVVGAITSGIKELIDLGAVTIVVPGYLPIGCSSTYLTIYTTIDEKEYDQAGCIKWLNKFSEYHNEQLQLALHQLRELHPHTNIIYADYYNAAFPLYQDPDQFGFTGSALKSCCGGGGSFNYNMSALCGSSVRIACDNPYHYINWDGVHLTEAAYRWIAQGILEGPYTIPHITMPCLMQKMR